MSLCFPSSPEELVLQGRCWAGRRSIWHGQCELMEPLPGVPLLISVSQGEQLGLSTFLSGGRARGKSEVEKLQVFHLLELLSVP